MNYKNYLLLAAIGLIWGSQFLFQDVAVAEISPFWVGASRSVIGTLTLVLLCRVLKLRSRSHSRNQWGLFALIGLLEATIPFVLVPWAQQQLDSSVVAVLMGTIPFFALLCAPLLIRSASITRYGLMSVLLGFGGLVLLFWPALSSGIGSVEPVRGLAVMGAAASFAVALLLLNRVKEEHPLIVARNVLAMASLQLVLIAFVLSPLEASDYAARALGSLVYLGVMCAGVVYYLYMALLQRTGPVFTSMTNYLVPAIGVVIGAVFNHEVVELTTWLALAVIVAALMLNKPPSAENKARPAPHGVPTTEESAAG
ncbi:DMT family transporter [Photobacterium atrarenae]|uniref:DMT family transporter n=1 Tax=Photobacterium atrarenae TaxID=865757 RepID=A0ABY5GKI6_9GAMM|nr:DMT family transporter [Photobacterium atrarenae]UTV29843.1 DMT family transporter [Photobacterium atrarenae]